MSRRDMPPSIRGKPVDPIAETLNGLTVSELLVVCKIHGIATNSSMRKADIVSALSQSAVVRHIIEDWKKDAPNSSLLVSLTCGAEKAEVHEGETIQKLRRQVSELADAVRRSNGRVRRDLDRQVAVGYAVGLAALGFCVTLTVARPDPHCLGTAMICTFAVLAVAALSYAGSAMVLREAYSRNEALLDEVEKIGLILLPFSRAVGAQWRAGRGSRLHQLGLVLQHSAICVSVAAGISLVILPLLPWWN